MRPFILTSDFIPTDDNISLLYKGPNYCFPNYSSFKNYLNFINDFIRKLQWNLLYKKNTFSNKNRFGVKPSTNWVSKKVMTFNVQQLSNKIYHSSLKILKNMYIRKTIDINISNNVKYCTADKGSNWVIMSNQSYINEGLKQLNTSFYDPISYSKSKHNLAAINRLIDFLYKQKYITLNEKRFLLSNTINKTRNFYMLPKIHKNTWSIPNIQPKGRPIVNCKHTETYQIAIFIDYFLQPLVSKSKSYIKDSFNFIAILNNINVEDTDILVSIDITSLYTNITMEGAIESIKLIFSRYPDKRRPDTVIINLLKIILYNNDFTFNDLNYIQKQGVAMGQRFAPSVANLYLSLWEENLFIQSRHSPIVWHRYIDDIFAIWRGNINDLKEFLIYTNDFYPNISITYDYDINKCIFLDLHIYKNDNCLYHKIHFKDTNNHSLLDLSSNHPKHIFKGIIYSQIRRWAALTSTRSDFSNTCREIFPIWHSKGYTKTIIRNSKNDVLKDLNLKDNWEHIFVPCIKCPYNQFLYQGNKFTINGVYYKIIGNYSCETINNIYLIFCTKCSLYYVGQCQNFHKRLDKHLNSIKNKCTICVHKHFWDSCSLNDFKCFIIDSAKTVVKLKIKESNYIKKFKTKYPSGLNIIENYCSTPSLVLPYNELSFKISSNIKQICKNQSIEIKSVYKQGQTLSNLLK